MDPQWQMRVEQEYVEAQNTALPEDDEDLQKCLTLLNYQADTKSFTIARLKFGIYLQQFCKQLKNKVPRRCLKAKDVLIHTLRVNLCSRVARSVNLLARIVYITSK